MNTITILIIGAVAGAVIFGTVGYFLTLMTPAKQEMILNYLVYAVVQAEQIFGSGTGRLKLAKVYNDFVKDLPAIAKLISYDSFCKLVDKALVKLEEMLKNNTISDIINNLKKKEQ